MSQIASLTALFSTKSCTTKSLKRIEARVQSDAEIVEQVLSGNRQAYGVLIERYERLSARSGASGWRMIGTWRKTWHKSHSWSPCGNCERLRDPSRFGYWILVITRRTASRYRVRRQREPVSVGDPHTLPARSGESLSGESRELMDLVLRLPKHEQTVIALRYLSGHTTQEISEITGRPLGTVTKQLSRACERIRAWLQNEAKS